MFSHGTIAASFRMKAWRPRILWAVKIALTFLILWMALRGVSPAEIREALLRVDRSWALPSIILYPALIIPVEAARYCLAGRLLQERQPTLGRWIQLYGESRPFFYLLPAAVGAEGLVWLRLRDLQWRHASCGFVLLLTRLAGVGVWALLAGLALHGRDPSAHLLARAPGFLQRPLPWLLLGLAVMAGTALAPALSARFRRVPAAPGGTLAMLGLLFLALVSALVSGLSAQAASQAARTPIPLLTALGFLAFFNFAMVLPISLGGFGLQEALILAMGLPMGWPAPALLAFSAVIHMQRLGLAAVGLAMFLGGPGRQVAPSALPVGPS